MMVMVARTLVLLLVGNTEPAVPDPEERERRAGIGGIPLTLKVRLGWSEVLGRAFNCMPIVDELNKV